MSEINPEMNTFNVVMPEAEQAKKVCTPRTKGALLCATGTIVVAGCVAGVVALTKEHEQTIEELAAIWEPIYGEGHSGLHEWTCGETTFDLLIDGNSVKFGPKLFTQREIDLLQSLNGDSNASTYQIFSSIDDKTKQCEFESDTYAGILETDDWIIYATIYATLDNKEYHGNDVGRFLRTPVSWTIRYRGHRI